MTPGSMEHRIQFPGMSTGEMEEARALGELVKSGWKPKRTIIYCAWDAEEPGLIGSTECGGNARRGTARARRRLYLNTDSPQPRISQRGGVAFPGDVYQSSCAVRLAGRSGKKYLGMAAKAIGNGIADANSGEERERMRLHVPPGTIRSPGIPGSDYTAFLDFAGRCLSGSLDYSGEGNGGVYHSVYDDFYWFTHFR